MIDKSAMTTIDLTALVKSEESNFSKVPFAGDSLSSGNIWLALIVWLVGGLDHGITYAFFRGGNTDDVERLLKKNRGPHDGNFIIIDTGQRFPSSASALQHGIVLRQHNQSANIWPDVFEFVR